METTIAERLLKVRNSLGFTQNQLAEKIGIKQGLYSKYETGALAISTQAIGALFALGVNLNWLLTGQGPMFNNVPAREDKQARIMRARDLIAIPVAADIAAGTGIEAFDVEPTEQLLLPRALLTLPGPYYAFKVDGESMEPHIQTGDYAVVTAAWHDLDIQSRICAVRTIDGLTLKRFYVEPGHCALLIPLNPNFPVTKYAPGDPDYTIVGLLMLVIRKYV